MKNIHETKKQSLDELIEMNHKQHDIIAKLLKEKDAQDELLRECLADVRRLNTERFHAVDDVVSILEAMEEKLKAALAIENSESCSIDSVKCEANNTCESEE